MLYKYTPPSYVHPSTQCETMTDKYYMDIDLKNYGALGHHGVETLRLGKIDYQPFADAFIMHYKSKKTNFVTSVRMSRLSWLVTPDFADFLQTFNLPEYQVFDAVVEHRNKRYPYKIMYFCYENLEVIDYSLSSWYLMIKAGYNMKASEKIDIQSIEQYREQQALLLPNGYIAAHKLVFIDNIQKDIVKLFYPYMELFIHHRLKAAIQAAGFTGIDFKPVGIPLYRHLTWADTGALVEECHCDYCESQQNKS